MINFSCYSTSESFQVLENCRQSTHCKIKPYFLATNAGREIGNNQDFTGKEKTFGGSRVPMAASHDFSIPTAPGTVAGIHRMPLTRRKKGKGGGSPVPMRMRRLSGLELHFMRRSSSCIRSSDGTSSRFAAISAAAATGRALHSRLAGAVAAGSDSPSIGWVG